MLKFSVIIPSVNGLPTLAECLNALEQQKCDFDFEIIVVDRTHDESAKYIKKNFPSIKLVKPSLPCGIPEMRFVAMNLASGEFLAIIEDHCIVPENWLTKLAEAHEKGYEIIGGAVENISQKRLIDWAVFLCEYSAFMPPVMYGEVDFVTGNNTSYRRTVLEKLDKALLKNYWEYFLHVELKRQGFKFFSTSLLIVNHKKEFGFFYFLSQRFHYSRSFAAMRKQKSAWTKQCMHLIYIPFLPFHQIFKIFQNVRRKKRNLKEFSLSLPFLLIFMLTYSLGELIGHLFGSGKSLLKVE